MIDCVEGGAKVVVQVLVHSVLEGVGMKNFAYCPARLRRVQLRVPPLVSQRRRIVRSHIKNRSSRGENAVSRENAA